MKEIYIYNNIENIHLPVPSMGIEVESGRNTSTITLLNFGEIESGGSDKLKTFTISTLFPDNDYSWLCAERKSSPYDYVDLLEKIRHQGAICHVVVAGTNINMNCTIQDIKYSEKDGTGDVYCDISFREYKVIGINLQTNTPTTNPKIAIVNPLKTNNKTYTVKSGDTLCVISKKIYGTTSKYTYLAKLNGLKNPNLIKVGQVLKYD